MVPGREMKILASMFEVAAVDDGHVICREGEAATQAYVVADGAVDVIVAGITDSSPRWSAEVFLANLPKLPPGLPGVSTRVNKGHVERLLKKNRAVGSS